jgi:3-deoxy-D-manno-octulosonic-acid transferase
METELWPNILHRAAGQGCRVLLANARLSERSARGYARIGPLTRQMLGHLDRVACQGEGDAARFLALGLPRNALRVTGSLKFDLDIDDAMRELVTGLRRSIGDPPPPVVLAASTHPGEDEQVLAAFETLRRSEPSCRLLLAPRHPERFEEVCSLARNAGWSVARRSKGAGPGPGTDVLLCDTMGELPALYGIATVAVIGGSLVPNGGHNPLEAAVWGVPVLSGPSMFNFEDVSARLLLAGAMIRLEASEDLAASLGSLLRDPDACRAMGQAGQRVIEQNRGVTERLLALVASELAGVASVAGEPPEA